MTVFIAHENLDMHGDDALVCLADRFNWYAFLLPPFWAIHKGLWGVLAIIVLGIIGLGFALQFMVFPATSVWLLGAWWLGFEANSLHGLALVKRGWREGGTYVADDLMQAERKYFGRKRRQTRSLERQKQRRVQQGSTPESDIS